MTILDSGDRTKFDTGAVRDMRVGKGRCDLMPLSVAAELMTNLIIKCINDYQNTGEVKYLYQVLKLIAEVHYKENDKIMTEQSCFASMLLDVSVHYEEGAKKYGECNWQKGIPQYCYIDSATRHYLKYIRGDQDEPHLRAFVWNILCLIWTVENIKE